MKLKDRIYGEIEISLPVAEEIIKCSFFERLKRISQFGVPDEFYHKNNFSRHEHSVGVMILLMKLGASEEEQIAGLLHDVSHSAFSHVIDWVLGDESKEDYQDKHHYKILVNSEIKGILEKHGFNPERIANYKNFSLLEREIPEPCADRVDYAFRELPSDIVEKCLKNLTTKNKKIVFKNQESARLFAMNYLRLHFEHWGSFESMARYRIFADALRMALEEKIINEEDFRNDDKSIILKLKESGNEKIKRILSILSKKSLTDLPRSELVVYRKFRYVDPEFIGKSGELETLTNADPEFKKIIEEAEIRNTMGDKVPII